MKVLNRRRPNKTDEQAQLLAILAIRGELPDDLLIVCPDSESAAKLVNRIKYWYDRLSHVQ